ncbi:uncharacterized protein LOC133910594 [Phragmites australis]|uniref:uncharacterized protein LOC133910592 n=1 Tax=Phragmites australis TaxID=29695 RepID=UPI002D768374|nr:uncharacterized protein LOC133910592 [Phragmites australis]XP_062208922.1 uncharacterized protein LOC133910594 [Phragmites australis]
MSHHFLVDSSSSEEDDDDEFILATLHQAHTQYALLNAARPGGSVPGRQYINRNREAGHWRLYEDYFSDAPTYGPTFFRRRFRMSRSLFLRILQAVEQHDDYFVQKRDRIRRLGLSPLQKITAAFRMLTYGVAADATDDYIRITESTAVESLKRFVKAIVEIFGDEYLRSPNDNDTARLLTIGEQKGFPAEGHAPEVNYTINDHNYTIGYYLADGIYPQWATFVKPIPSPQGNKRKYFTKVQAAVRKEVERAFGVLQSRFAIVRGPARFWDQDTLGQIMTACIIMHNMIVEDERDAEGDHHFDGMGEVVTASHRPTAELQAFLRTHLAITNRETHSQLRDDLVEHLWKKYGGV